MHSEGFAATASLYILWYTRSRTNQKLLTSLSTLRLDPLIDLLFHLCGFEIHAVSAFFYLFLGEVS
jgi:hypothetical protein